MEKPQPIIEVSYGTEAIKEILIYHASTLMNGPYQVESSSVAFTAKSPDGHVTDTQNVVAVVRVHFAPPKGGTT